MGKFTVQSALSAAAIIIIFFLGKTQHAKNKKLVWFMQYSILEKNILTKT